jgi:hypothetical protein
MSDEQQDATIPNASEIIERFGGIRPMATKMGVPVTTVQGWKQRNVIPANRRDDIIRAASENRINLGDLLIGITTAGETDFSKPSRNDFQISTPREHTTKPLFYAGLLILAGAVIGGVVAIAPKVRDIAGQQERIQELEAELEQTRLEQQRQKQAGGNGVSEGVKKSLGDLQNKVQEMSKQAETYSAALNDLKTGTMPQRIAKLEGHMNQVLGQANALGLSSMLQKIQTMQQSSQGMDALSAIVQAMLNQTAGTGNNNQQSMTARLEQLRRTDPNVNQVLEGVAPEDMKAAVMLIGLSQLRQSLMRDNVSFDQDLALLKATAAKNDPALQAAIDRLAPQAKAGILTPAGLSREFRAMTGDIVAASLSGQDVSIQEKLMARMNDIMIVEKAGQQISGTPTQQIIAVAQKQLDEGNIQGAITTLQTLQGPAAEKAQPFISQAQATVFATQLQRVLGQNIIGQLIGSQSPALLTQGGLSGLISQIQGMIPGYGLITDPESGFSMQRPLPQFKLPAKAP